ncbi:acyltransferase [Acidipila sp. EB88]|uniref:acyltransferase family protein n=1 Tax=Acidipila sp. EB88 TaxID=2305226 RepID=UPI0013153CDD|nr:acyltransferase [Acidipila sp. EB88]
MTTPVAPSAPESVQSATPAHAGTAIGAKASSRFYRPELDALRFFAFFAVFLTHGLRIDVTHGILRHHAALAQGIIFLHRVGGFGLSLFFFLSAFLITTLLVIEKDRTGDVDLKSFYVRRILRIWPLYFCYIAVAFVVGHYWADAAFNVRALLSFYLLSANWYVLTVGLLTPMVSFLWSISVEEQFYLVWPTVMRKMTITGMRNFCIALIVLAVATAAYLGAHHNSFIHMWFNSAVEMLFFAAGGLMALRYGLRKQKESMAMALGGLVVGLGCWVLANRLIGFTLEDSPESGRYAAVVYPLVAAGSAALLWAFLHMPKFLIRRELVYLGRISYGLYVFHGFALLIGEIFVGPHLRAHLWLIVSFLLSVLLATLSYEYFEKPFLRLKHRFEVVHSRAA